MKFCLARQVLTGLSAWCALSVVLSACEGEDAASSAASMEMPLATQVVATEKGSDGLAADRTAVSASVDNTGSAQVTVPIWAPDGRLGIQPSLSLQYSSDGGNGVVGAGWSLSGLTQISRCSRTAAEDGAAKRVQFNANDRFCLNGERLVAVGGTYGAADAVYETERDSYVKVLTPTVDAKGPTTFVVYAKDGTISTFGETSLNATVSGSNGDRLSWNLSRVEDRSKNYMTVRYNQNDTGENVRLPVEIQYTGNSTAGLTPNRSIQFIYDPRPDPSETYTSGLMLRLTKRLSGIYISGPAPTTKALLRSYRLKYRNDSVNGQSILQSVQECDGASVCKPTTEFGYTPSSVNFEELQTGIFFPGPDPYWIGDINGDGRDDLMGFRSGSQAKYYYRLANASGTFGAEVDAQIPLLPSQLPFGSCMEASPLAKEAVLIDLNHDGRSEFIRSKCIDNRPWYVKEIYAFESNKFVPLTGENQIETDWANHNRYDYPNPFSNSPGTLLTSNGTADISFGAQLSGNTVYTRGLGQAYHLEAIFVASKENVSYGDRTGLLGRQETSDTYYDSTISPVQKTNLGLNPVVKSGDTIIEYFPDPLKTFDANGDGLLDVAYESAPSVVWINTGTPQFLRQEWGAAIQDQSGFSDRWMDFDIDGDGRSDRIRRDMLGRPITQYVKSKQGMFELRNFPSPIAAPLKVVDTNGDGLEDILGIKKSAIDPTLFEFVVSVRRGYKHDVLNRITDGFGKTYEFTYAPLNAVTIPRSPLDPPLPAVPASQQRVLQSPLLVSALKDRTSRLYSRTYTYQYSDGREDTLGYGFLGFAKVVKTEASTNTVETTTYDLTPRLCYPLRGKPYSMTTSVITDFMGLTQAGTNTTRTMEYVDFSGPPMRFGKLITTTAVDHWSKGQGTNVTRRVAETSQTQQFDAYGNVTSVQSTVLHSPTGTPAGGYKVSSSTSGTYTFGNDPASWLIGKLLTSTETSIGEDGSSSTRTKSFTYDSLGRLETSIEASGTPDVLTTRTSHNSMGLILRAEQQDSGTNVRATEFEFDPADYIYPKSKTDIVKVQTVEKRHKTQFTYHSGLGVLTSQTDPNNVVTSWSHDGFGRLRAEVSPVGAHKEIHYRRGTAGPLAVETTVTGGTKVTVDSDIMGRPVMRQTVGFDGRTIIEEKDFGALGQQVVSMLPRFAGEAQTPIVFAYDGLGRITRRDAPDGTAQTYEYRTSTEIDVVAIAKDEVGRTTTTYTDPVGQTYQSTRGGITTTKRFGAFGQVTQIRQTAWEGSTQKSCTTTFEYDRRGRRTAVVDPDTGRHETQYNGFGEATYEISVVGSTRTVLASYERDELGRPFWINTPQGGTRIQYDRDGALGKVDWERSPDNITTWYGYTPAGQLSQQVWRDAADKTYSIGTTYDGYGRISNVQYPSPSATSPFSVSYQYNANGYLRGVYDNSATPKPYWEAKVRNARGQLEQEDFADSQSTHAYDLMGRLTGIKSNLKNNTSPTVQQIEYQYWPDGNLWHRNDFRKATSETFEYDANDRLAKWGLSVWNSGQSPHSETYAYDALGNIKTLTKDPAETREYTYVPNKPHTVANVKFGTTTISYGYDGRGLQTSRTTAPATSSDRTVRYTSFDLPSSITTSAGATTTFQYDAKHTRFRKTYPNGDQIVYAGPYEKRTLSGVTTHVYSISAAGRPIGQVFWTEGAGGAITHKRVSYIHDDLINSADALTDGQTGITRHAYRPFGRVLSDAGLSTDFSPRTVTSGYGGHEHDPEFQLINMGGRIYDPELIQFMTPDPVVANALDGEAYNPYRYARYNPFKYVDPSGFSERAIHRTGSFSSGRANSLTISSSSSFRRQRLSPLGGVDRGEEKLGQKPVYRDTPFPVVFLSDPGAGASYPECSQFAGTMTYAYDNPATAEWVLANTPGMPAVGAALLGDTYQNVLIGNMLNAANEKLNAFMASMEAVQFALMMLAPEVGTTLAGLRVYAEGTIAARAAIAAEATVAAPIAASSLSAERLGAQLLLEEAASPFTTAGGLKPEVIRGSTEIINGARLKNTTVIRELTSDGSSVANWGKYATETFNSPYGPYQMHFYQNPTTGAVNYTWDFKAVFNAMSGVPKK